MMLLQNQSKTRNSLKALVFGEILWDVVGGKRHLGGAPLNFATHVKRCGSPSATISALGNDEWGKKAFEMVSDFEVDLSMVQFNDYPTGYVPVTLQNGQPSYEIVQNVAYDHIRKTQLNHEKISEYNVFYFGTLAQRNKKSYDSLYEILNRHTFDHIFYDVNLRKNCYSKETILNSLEYCTILKLNDLEAVELSKILFNSEMTIEQFSKAIHEQFSQISTIITTAGADGAFVFSANDFLHVPTQAIKVVNSVGAGDAFSASFMATFVKTKNAEIATQIGNKIGGFVATSNEAIPEYPAEIVELFNTTI